MNTKQLFAIAVLAGTIGAASAEGFGPGNLDLWGAQPGVVNTRAQVQEELAEARRHGLIVYGDADVPQDEAAVVIVKTRAQGEAELAEARRLGIVHFGEADSITTPEQEQLISEAGRRVVAQVAAK